LVACTVAAFAQEYPHKPIRMLVGFAPGGSTDVVARLIGQKISDQLGQPIVVENRAGAAGSIAIERVVSSAADGYTLLMLAGSQVVQASMSSKLSYDLVRDLTPVSLVVTGPVVLVVNPSVPADSVDKLIAHLRAQPGKLSYASDGVGGVQHLAGELFKMMAKVDMVHVPYKGGAEGPLAVATGQVQIGVPSITGALPLMASGKLRALAVSSMKRASSLPSVPTLNEAGLTGYDFSSWQGMAAPAGMPRALVTRLNAVIAKAVNPPDIRESLSRQGREVDTGTPEQFAQFIRDEVAKNARLIRFVGLKTE
jgi:tripartite-type tricarboxylate transporter receptor subunit TctC